MSLEARIARLERKVEELERLAALPPAYVPPPVCGPTYAGHPYGCNCLQCVTQHPFPPYTVTC